MAKKKIEQPNVSQERELASVMYNERDEYQLRGKTLTMSWLRGSATDKLTRIMLKKERFAKDGFPLDENKVACKCAAAIRLNGYWKILFFWWILWRWYFYIKQYSEFELMPMVELAQKKTPVKEYFELTTLLTGLKETKMMMTRKELERFRTQAERSGAKGGK